MLNRDLFNRVMKMLLAVTTVQVTEESTLDVYYLLLKNCDGTVLQNAIISLLKEKINMYGLPSPAEILKYYKAEELKTLDLNFITNQVRNDISTFGAAMQPPFNDRVKQAIDAQGGWVHICRSQFDETKFKEAILDGLYNREVTNANSQIESGR